MKTHPRLSMIRSRLEQALSPTYLEVIDESDDHIGHAGHQGGGHHFAVKISAPSLETVSRIEAHRKIYMVLNDMLPHDIHALRITIVHH